MAEEGQALRGIRWAEVSPPVGVAGGVAYNLLKDQSNPGIVLDLVAVVGCLAIFLAGLFAMAALAPQINPPLSGALRAKLIGMWVGRRVLPSRVGDWRGGFRPVSSPRRFKPCVRFSRTRLSDIVHRLACAVALRTFPVRR